MSQIGFKKTTVKCKTPLVVDDFKNAICYGQTGSGKTIGFILPNIEERIKLGHSLLVYDFKGNLHEQVKYIANKYNKLDDVLEIGKIWGNNINILQHCSLSDLEDIYKILYGDSSDIYWQNASFALFGDLVILLKTFLEIKGILEKYLKDDKYNMMQYFFEFFKEFKIYNLSFRTLHAISNDPIYLSGFVAKAEEASVFLEKILQDNDIYNKSDKLCMLYDGMVKKLESFKIYKNLKDSNETSGKYGVIGVLSSILSPIANLEFLNSDELNLAEALNSSKIIIINVSTFSENIIAALNISIYNELSKRVSYNQTKPISIFIDEAQKVLNDKYIPDVDVCRENRFEYIFATQDESLLANKIGSYKMNEIKRNIATIYSFKTNDEMLAQTNALKTFEYIDFKDNSKYCLNPTFIDKDKLEMIELSYQQSSKNLDNFTLTNRNASILLHHPSLYTSHQAYQKNLKTNEIKIIDCIKTDKLAKIRDRFKDAYPHNSLFDYMVEKNNKIGDSFLSQLKKENSKLRKEIEQRDKKITKIEEDLATLSKTVLTYTQRISAVSGTDLFGGYGAS